MAARNPTDWTTWLDEDALRAGEKIITTEPDKVFNDLQYYRDAPQLLWSHCGPFPNNNSTAYVDQARSKIWLKDRAAASETGTLAWSVRGWMSDAAATGTFRLTTPTGTSTISVSSTTPAWLTVSTGHTEDMDGTAIECVIAGKRDTGTGAINLDAVLIYAEED